MSDTTPCPSWCDRVQCQEAMPADRYHQHVAVIPIVHRINAAETGACDLAAVLFTSATGPDDTWIGLELDENAAAITLSLESARRLHRRLGAVLGLA